jgi:hypothetical protein
MTSYSLRPIPVEGEYRLSINDLRMRGEITSGARDKIRAASLFMELALRLFDLILDILGMSPNESFSPSH